jgi:putative hemolysin
MDIVLLLLLILLNGVFAMSEMSVVSSRKSRLQSLAEGGSIGADAALSLHQSPSNFLSTIQVGITSVGILSGAIGEAVLADPLTERLAAIPLVAPYAHIVALTVTVVGLTYFSVVIGELVPKQLALLAPEGIAALIARPMMLLSPPGTSAGGAVFSVGSDRSASLRRPSQGRAAGDRRRNQGTHGARRRGGRFPRK